MNRKVLPLVAALAFTSVAAAKPVPPTDLAQRANTQAENISDAAAFIEELDLALGLAAKGSYGKLPRGAMQELDHAGNTIKSLLKGHDSATELPPDERIELFNAHSLITSIIRNDDKNRQVCRRSAQTGSRLPKVQCQTIAQLEERARSSKFRLDGFQRGYCVPGPGLAHQDPNAAGGRARAEMQTCGLD